MTAALDGTAGVEVEVLKPPLAMRGATAIGDREAGREEQAQPSFALQLRARSRP